MTRLTQARMDRWERDLSKAADLAAKVRAEQRAHLSSAKGGRYNHLLSCVNGSGKAIEQLGDALARTKSLSDREARAKAPTNSGASA